MDNIILGSRWWLLSAMQIVAESLGTSVSENFVFAVRCADPICRTVLIDQENQLAEFVARRLIGSGTTVLILIGLWDEGQRCRCFGIPQTYQDYGLLCQGIGVDTLRIKYLEKAS